jgi:hypothetical protein
MAVPFEGTFLLAAFLGFVSRRTSELFVFVVLVMLGREELAIAGY